MATVLQLIRDEDVLHVTQNPAVMDGLEAIVYREILTDERFRGQLATRLQKAVKETKRGYERPAKAK